MPALDGYWTPKEAAVRYGVNWWTIKLIADRAGICRRIGRQRVIAEADIPQLELGLRVLGYGIPTVDAPISK